MKFCKKCKIDKEDEKFYKDKTRKGGLSYLCSECNRTRCRIYHKENPDVFKNYHAKMKPETRRKYKLRMFSLTLDDFNIILATQENKCSICKDLFTDKNYPVVDHDHSCCSGYYRSCGKCIRGLLCSRCNMSIGGFRDNPEFCRTAADYLEIHKNLLTFQNNSDKVTKESGDAQIKTR